MQSDRMDLSNKRNWYFFDCGLSWDFESGFMVIWKVFYSPEWDLWCRAGNELKNFRTLFEFLLFFKNNIKGIAKSCCNNTSEFLKIFENFKEFVLDSWLDLKNTQQLTNFPSHFNKKKFFNTFHSPSSSDLENFHEQLGKLQKYGFSPRCRLKCALKCAGFEYVFLHSPKLQLNKTFSSLLTSSTDDNDTSSCCWIFNEFTRNISELSFMNAAQESVHIKVWSGKLSNVVTVKESSQSNIKNCSSSVVGCCATVVDGVSSVYDGWSSISVKYWYESP